MKTQIFVADVDCLKNKDLFNYYFNKLPKYRQNKISQYLFDGAKYLSMGVGVLLQYALMKNDINILNDVDYKKNNKPYLKNQKTIFFNLSHSKTKVMCIISDCEVGCDVEKINATKIKVAEKFFFNTELDLINKQSSLQAQTKMFFKLWTLKESFMKVTGLGFKLSLSDFCININEKNEIDIIQKVDNKKYYFKSFDLSDGYMYACASLDNNFDKVAVLDLSSYII